MKAVFFTTSKENRISFVFARRMAEFAKRLELTEEPVLLGEIDEKRALLAEAEVILTTWNMPALTEEQVREYFPKLKYIFYSAASVRYFAEGYLKAGVTIVTAADAMSDFVVQYAVAAIWHLSKGFYQAARLYTEQKDFATGKHLSCYEMPGNYQTTIGIIGAGSIGSRVIRQLNNYEFRILVFDPFLPDEKAEALGVTKCSLEELFAQSDVISNHLANNPQTVDMLNYSLFRLMKPHASFLNTGRGAQVVEEDLARALTEDPTRFALLDVTRQEPIPEGHIFRSVPNLLLTPHIAGVGVNEVLAYDDLLLTELDNCLAGRPMGHTVTMEMLKTMA